MIPPNAKFGAAIFVVFLFTEIVDGNEKILGEPLTMDTVIRDTCSRSLSTLIFQICTGNLRISDVPSGRLSNVRGKRASLLFKDRLKRQIADECCLNPCSVSQLVQYCPETWWACTDIWDNQSNESVSDCQASTWSDVNSKIDNPQREHYRWPCVAQIFLYAQSVGSSEQCDSKVPLVCRGVLTLWAWSWKACVKKR